MAFLWTMPYRVVPMFARLRPQLEEAWEMAREGQTHVIPEDLYLPAAHGPRGWNNCSLRTTFQKIVVRAGLASWPRLFHALRASCESDLAREYPITTVCKWIGNTVSIAVRHYVHVTDQDFERASRVPDEATQNPTHAAPVRGRNASSKKQQDPAFPEKNEALRTCTHVQVEAAGIEPDSGSGLQDNDLGKSPHPFGTESGTVGDETGSLPPDLAMVVSAWPMLSEGDRKAVLSIVREASANRHGEYDADGGGIIYDFALSGDGITQHPAAAVSGDVLRELMARDELNCGNPTDVVTKAMRQELSACGGLGADPLIKAELARDYPKVKELGRVINADTRLADLPGRWQPYPVEYKRGRRKPEMSYLVQLCAQALCLEEMLRATVPAGALYHGKSRRRQQVAFDAPLRERTQARARELHELIATGRTPPSVRGPKCKFCSLADKCLPKLPPSRSARQYLTRTIEDLLTS